MNWLCCPRRIRELKENNTKKFIEERKRHATRHARQTDALKRSQQEHCNRIRKENSSVSRLIAVSYMAVFLTPVLRCYHLGDCLVLLLHVSVCEEYVWMLCVDCVRYNAYW